MNNSSIIQRSIFITKNMLWRIYNLYTHFRLTISSLISLQEINFIVFRTWWMIHFRISVCEIHAQLNILRWQSHPISRNRATGSVIESRSSDGGSHDLCRGSQYGDLAFDRSFLFPLPHGYFPVNPHGIGRWYDAVKDRIGKGTASQSFMPAFRHELWTEDGGCFLASNFPHFHRYDSLKSALYIHAVSKNINTFPKNQGRIRAAIAVEILDFTVMYR